MNICPTLHKLEHFSKQHQQGEENTFGVLSLSKGQIAMSAQLAQLNETLMSLTKEITKK